MSVDYLNIVHEDEDLLVLNKPSDLVCHPTKGDIYSSLISRVRLYLGEGHPAHLVNRLDRETSGIVLLAKTDDSNRRLRILFQDRLVTKEYHAIVYGHPIEDSGVIDAPLGKDESSDVTIRDCVRPDGAASSSAYRVLQRFNRPEGDFSLLHLSPKTGRKHQLRIHCAHLGHPIVGDKLYGLESRFYLDFIYDRLTLGDWGRLMLPNQALHALHLAFPWKGSQASFQAPPEAIFTSFLEGNPLPPAPMPATGEPQP